MVKNNLKHFMRFLWIFSIVMVQTCFAIPFEQWTVQVVNNMKSGQPLFLHCKSKDDDLGVHKLRAGQQFSWKFRENIVQSTLFWCYMRSNHGHIAGEVFWTNSIYAWLSYRCGNQTCVWSVRDDGLYLKDAIQNKFQAMRLWTPGP